MIFGREPIEYGYMPQAHTDGDIYVYFPGPNILVAGDVVSVDRYPIVDWSTGGWIGGMIEGAEDPAQRNQRLRRASSLEAARCRPRPTSGRERNAAPP